MKKIVTIILSLTLTLTLLGCSSKSTPDDTIVIGASPTPHAEILEVMRPILTDVGYKLEIKEFTDYIQPNLATVSGEIDANFFQHQPFLDDFNSKNNADLQSIASVHYEPLGIYPGKTSSLADLKEGAIIAIPNDTTNEARALLLLQSNGLIELDPNTSIDATPKNIIKNDKNFVFKEIEAAQLSRSLQDVDIAVINGNYAILGGLNINTDALAKEEQDSLAATTYANILVVDSKMITSPKIKILIDVINSPTVKEFINQNYSGAIIPVQ